MEIQLLPAEYGDAIVIKTKAEGKPFVIVIDGGPESTSADIVDTMNALGQIDLMILTHFDEDHILGIIKYVEQFTDSKMPVKQIWCNCAQQVDIAPDTPISDAGYENANNLAHLLRKQAEIQDEFQWKEDIDISFSYKKDDLCIYALSPTSDTLNKLKDEYEDYIKEHPMNDDEPDSTDIASVSNNPDAKKSINDLVISDKPRSLTLLNQASMAFLIQAEGKNILMLGDADAEVVANALEHNNEIETPLVVDLMKLSHHGSKNNVSKHLLSLIKCNDYAITTNGGTHNWCHPDRKTLALILRSAGKREENPVKFYFNYCINEIQKRTGVLISEQEMQEEKCEMIYKPIITL